MGFIDKIIHKLDDQYNGIVYQNDKIAEIKNNIQSLLNTNEEDCLCLINGNSLLICSAEWLMTNLMNSILLLIFQATDTAR